MSTNTLNTVKKFAFEFLCIFVGVFAAFALDNWNDKRKEHKAATDILKEISNGLKADLQDVLLNKDGHAAGIRAASYFGKIVLAIPQQPDSAGYHYFNLLRDFVTQQNVSGYESLKSKGLELIENDSLRNDIIQLYENDYSTLKKLEESYAPLQFYESYYNKFTETLGPYLIWDNKGILTGITQPLNISDAQKKILLMDLTNIKSNRMFAFQFYVQIEEKIKQLQQRIDAALADK